MQDAEMGIVQNSFQSDDPAKITATPTSTSNPDRALKTAPLDRSIPIGGDDFDPAELERTRRISTAEGVLAQIHTSIAGPGSIFLSKFALMLGATSFQFGLLSAFGQLTLVLQPLGTLFTRRARYRKPTVIASALIGRSLVLLFGALPFLLPASPAITVWLALVCASAAVQAIGANAWIAWISDMVPRPIRGRFFARRSQWLLLAGAGAGYLLGAFVDWFQFEWELPLLGKPGWVRVENLPAFFLVAFALAALVGAAGQLVLRRQPERRKAREDASFMQLMRQPFRDPNFRRLLIFACWWMLAVGVGAPFWQPFMIGKLGMSMIEIQIYATLSTVCSLAVLGLWGRFIDRFGNRRAMAVSILMGGCIPLAWLFVGPGHYGILFLEAGFSGIMWAGSGLVGMNFVLAVAPEEKRQVYAGLHGSVSGLAMIVTMLLSGIYLPPPLAVCGLALEPEQVLFGATGILRWTALIPLLWISEPEVPTTAETLLTIREFAKVRIATFSERIIRRR